MNHARATAFAAARAIGADAYNRNGNVISMRLPCHTVCEGFGEDVSCYLLWTSRQGRQEGC